MVFQFGDFYGIGSDSFLSKLLISLIGPIVTLLLFWLKIWWDKREKLNNERKTRFNQLEYFNSIVQLAVEVTSTQLLELESNLSDYNSESYELNRITFVADLDLDRLINFKNHDDYYKAYCDYFEPGKESIKSYNNFYRSAHQLKLIMQILNDQLKIQLKYEDDYKLVYRENVDQIILKLNQVKVDRNKNNFSEDSDKKLKDILRKTSDGSIGPGNLNQFKSIFLEPLLIGLNNDLAIFDKNDELKNKVNISLNIIDNIKYNMSDFISELKLKMILYNEINTLFLNNAKQLEVRIYGGINK